VVVKPADRDRGEGVSIGLRDGNAVRAAFETARSLGRRVLVERQVEGLCHRLLVVEGAMVFATRRNPKSVVGNGRNSVEELVARGNAARMLEAPWKRSKPFPLDELAVESLRRAGLTPQSVPAAGSFVPLRIIESTEWGGWTEDVTERVHPDNAAAALDAAALLGLRVAGVDMISADISMPWHENGAVINEVNFAPFFGGNLHSPKAQAFIRRLVGGDGRIPVWAVLAPDETGEALGKRLQQRQTAAGLRCWMTTSSRTDAPSREAFPLSQEGLHGRCLALLCRPDVDALVLVIGEDAQLEAGLPVDRLDRCYRVRPAGDSRDGGLPELLRARTVEGGFLEIDADDPKTLTD
jgi:cyanophycin synthetase